MPEQSTYDSPEEWRPVAGFPHYEVSNLSRLRSYWGRGPAGVKTVPVIVSGWLMTIGYQQVSLTRMDGSKEKKLLHRIIAEAWIPNPDGLPQINHKDGCKTNNALSNLEWVTRKENMQHGWDMRLNNGARHFTDGQVHEIDTLLATERIYLIAQRYGVHPATIHDIRKRRTYRHVKQLQRQ